MQNLSGDCPATSLQYIPCSCPVHPCKVSTPLIVPQHRCKDCSGDVRADAGMSMLAALPETGPRAAKRLATSGPRSNANQAHANEPSAQTRRRAALHRCCRTVTVQVSFAGIHGAHTPLIFAGMLRNKKHRTTLQYRPSSTTKKRAVAMRQP